MSLGTHDIVVVYGASHGAYLSFFTAECLQGVRQL